MSGSAEILAAGMRRSRADGAAAEALSRRVGAFALLLRHAPPAMNPGPAGWSGAGRDAFTVRVAVLRAQLGRLADQLETVGIALAALAISLREVQAETAAARRVLASAGSELAEPGVRQLQTALTAFDDADRRAAEVVCDALLARLVPAPGLISLPASSNARGEAAALAGAVVQIPATPVAPAAVSVWWAGLPAAARRELATSWASWVTGGRDGVPPQVRDAINRRQLAYAIVDAQRSYDLSRHPSFVHDLTTFARRLVPWPLSLLTSRLDPIAARLRALQQLSATIRASGSELLDFDAGGSGRAVVANGDVGAARSVAVLVPGMDTGLGDVPHLMQQGDGLSATSGRGAVVVSWLGYATPGVLQVASDARATVGAVALSTFTAGLRATAATRQRLTVIGHSYGTLVAGLAARHVLPADDLVLLASPGVEAQRASQLRVPAGHVWAARAPTDPIQLVFWPGMVAHLFGLPRPQVFGPDPAAAAFGARHFNTGGAYGHSGYFTSGSKSLDNLGRIVSGRSVRS